VKPPSGSFDTVKDLSGLVVCGTAEDVAEQVTELADMGISEFVFDFRLQYDRYEYALEEVGEKVFPLLNYKPDQN